LIQGFGGMAGQDFEVDHETLKTTAQQIAETTQGAKGTSIGGCVPAGQDLANDGLAGAGLTGTGASASLYGLDDLYGLPLWLKVYYTFIMVLGRIEVVAFFLVIQTAVHFLRRRW